MKKLYKIASIACLGLMLSSTNINAQTADFENLTLPAESYWDGSDLSGTHNNGIFTSEFTSGDFTFPNLFDTTWGAPGYWLGGFAYSNMTDSVTSGPGNKYSSKTGGGNGSSNYVVASNNSYITNNGMSLGSNLSFYISNSTYAYNSMKDGDAFAKKFGGPTGNDPDWFKVTIKAFGSGNPTGNNFDFYLADFRFSDNSQDYIVKDWVFVDFGFSIFDSLYFELSSSDVGTWGMNTPAFFCLDDIFENALSIDELNSSKFSFYPNPTTNLLNIKAENNIEQLLITDMSGRTIKTINSNNTKQEKVDVSDLKSGIYFIQVVSNGVSQVQKFIKQ